MSNSFDFTTDITERSFPGTINGFIYISTIAYDVRSKPITTVGRHMWAIIYAVVFDRKDCYIMVRAASWR